MKISGSHHAQPVAKHAFAAARHAEARDHERSLERSARDSRVRPQDANDRVAFGEFLRRENLEALDGPDDAGMDSDRSDRDRYGAPRIGDVFSSASESASATDAAGYNRRGQGVYTQATSGFTVRTLDVIA